MSVDHVQHSKKKKQVKRQNKRGQRPPFHIPDRVQMKKERFHENKKALKVIAFKAFGE